MAKARMVKHEAVKVRVVGVKDVGFVQGVEIFDIGGNLHLIRYPILDNGSERVRRCSLRKRKFRISVHHGFWSDEHEVDG